MATIVIKVSDTGEAPFRPIEIEGEVFGRWAAHRTYRAALGNYSVTHVPSGLTAATHLTRADAHQLAKLLTFSLDVETLTDAHILIIQREVIALRREAQASP